MIKLFSASLSRFLMQQSVRAMNRVVGFGRAGRLTDDDGKMVVVPFSTDDNDDAVFF